MSAAAAAAFGAAAMSYVQLVGDRAGGPDALSRLRGRSRCPGCDTALPARDLLPVLGFLLLRGHCRCCHGVIPARYLLAELAAATWCAASAAVVGPAGWLALLLIVPCLTVVLTSAAIHRAGWRWIVVALLPPSGVAVLTVGVGAAVTGRWLLYSACGTAGATALLATVAMTRDRSQSKTEVRTRA